MNWGSQHVEGILTEKIFHREWCILKMTIFNNLYTHMFNTNYISFTIILSYIKHIFSIKQFKIERCIQLVQTELFKQRILMSQFLMTHQKYSAHSIITFMNNNMCREKCVQYLLNSINNKSFKWIGVVNMMMKFTQRMMYSQNDTFYNLYIWMFQYCYISFSNTILFIKLI